MASFRAAPSFSSPLSFGKQPGFFGWNASKTVANDAAGHAAAYKGNAIRSLIVPSLKDASLGSVVVTVAVIVLTLLACEQIIYRRKKAGLPGPTWTMPVIGKFADSVKPSLVKYKQGWDSGPLSVASVFHM